LSLSESKSSPAILKGPWSLTVMTVLTVLRGDFTCEALIRMIRLPAPPLTTESYLDAEGPKRCLGATQPTGKRSR
jgi:hypothetical protein